MSTPESAVDYASRRVPVLTEASRGGHITHLEYVSALRRIVLIVEAPR